MKRRPKFSKRTESRINYIILNFSMYAEAEKANCSTFCEGCMACLTAYVIYFCSETHYEKCLKKVARFVVEQNEQVSRDNSIVSRDLTRTKKYPCSIVATR